MAEVYGRCKTQCYHRKRLWEPGQMAVFKDKKSVHHCFEYCGVVAKVDEAKAIVEAQKQKAIEEGQLAEGNPKAPKEADQSQPSDQGELL